ncbi:MAG: hypothetical protein MUD12_07390 [Spirochaetes bacterium]|nr:hypothetical protein [Spirochaetota bacterium]
MKKILAYTMAVIFLIGSSSNLLSEDDKEKKKKKKKAAAAAVILTQGSTGAKQKGGQAPVPQQPNKWVCRNSVCVDTGTNVSLGIHCDARNPCGGTAPNASNDGTQPQGSTTPDTPGKGKQGRTVKRYDKKAAIVSNADREKMKASGSLWVCKNHICVNASTGNTLAVYCDARNPCMGPRASSAANNDQDPVVISNTGKSKLPQKGNAGKASAGFYNKMAKTHGAVKPGSISAAAKNRGAVSPKTPAMKAGAVKGIKPTSSVKRPIPAAKSMKKTGADNIVK